MINRAHDLPVVKQAGLLWPARNSFYYLPRPVPRARFAIMRRIDVLHLTHPFPGSRMLGDLMRAGGMLIGCVAVVTRMRWTEIEALWR